MTEYSTSAGDRHLIERVRHACIEAALAGYEDASIRGLCQEGAWEAAVSGIRRTDLSNIAVLEVGDKNDGCDRETLTADDLMPEAEAASANPLNSSPLPHAGNVAATTGALSAGLLQCVADASTVRGPERFQSRARSISGRASLLQASLSRAAGRDSEAVGRWLSAERSEAASEPLRVAAHQSLHDIASRCSRVAILAVEVSKDGYEPIRSSAAIASNLSSSASLACLQLLDEKVGAADEDGAESELKRRIWRIRLVLQRASTLLEADGRRPIV